MRQRNTVSFALFLALPLLLSQAACSKDGTPGAPEKPAAAQPAAAPSDATRAPLPVAPPRGPEYAVYSLAGNRLSAHLVREGGLLVPGGTAGIVKYLRFRRDDIGWQLKRERDGQKISVPGGNTFRMFLPLSRAQAANPQLHLRVYSATERRLGVRINGRQDKEVTVQLAAGWSTAQLTLPADVLVAGENEVIFFASPGQPLELAWLELGGTKPAEGALATRGHDAASDALLLPERGGLAHYVIVPDKALLAGDLDDAACSVTVSAAADEGAPVTGKLTGRGSAVDLGALAGKAVRLELIATAAGCPAARLSQAALVLPGAAPSVTRAATKPKHVVLWVMDSLRADRVRTFVPRARATVPNFDRLAETSTVFLHTYVQGNESKASHASLWSSQYPVRHHFFNDRDVLAASFTTLDEVAKAAGLYASGVSGNGYIIGRRGFGTAWDSYHNHIHEGGGLTGADILGAALKTVEGKAMPWLLYLGTIDTHVSWRAKDPWIAQYDPQPYTGRFKLVASGADVGAMAAGKLKVTPRDIEHIRAIYDSNVSYQDDLVGKLGDTLKMWGQAEDTMIIITADHGDEQWEAGRVGHGGSLRESLVHVPLVIHYPPLFPAGKVPEGTEIIDVLPTIADALGVKADGDWQGSSLFELSNGVGRGYPRLTMASQYEDAHAVRLGPWKLRSSGGGSSQLYNLDEEPEELNDRAQKNPIARRALEDPLWLLRAYNKEWRKSRWGHAANVTAEFAKDLKE